MIKNEKNIEHPQLCLEEYVHQKKLGKEGIS